MVKSLTDKVCYNCCVVCLVLMTLYLILFVGFQVPHETCVSWPRTTATNSNNNNENESYFIIFFAD